MSYKEIKLYNEIKNELINVIDAENNAAAWKHESKLRMRDVSALITAAKKVNKGIEIDGKKLLDEIREELDSETENAEPCEQESENA